MQKKVIAVVGIAVGVAAIFLFFILEDMAQPMVLVNRYTPVFAGLAVMSALALVVFLRKGPK